MTIWRILSFLCRVAGFIQLAESLWWRHESVVKAKEEANAPLTNKEEIRDFGDW